jgi:hypothetical protein
MLVTFAEKALSDGGYRLLKHAVWHASDPGRKNFQDAKVQLGIHSNKLCAKISHACRASMKRCNYRMVVAFREDEIVACKCECQRGTRGDNKHLCVHIIPKIYEHVLSLFVYLSGKLCIELKAKLSEQLCLEELPEEEIPNVLSSIHTLLIASRHAYVL